MSKHSHSLPGASGWLLKFLENWLTAYVLGDADDWKLNLLGIYNTVVAEFKKRTRGRKEVLIGRF